MMTKTIAALLSVVGTLPAPLIQSHPALVHAIDIDPSQFLINDYIDEIQVPEEYLPQAPPFGSACNDQQLLNCQVQFNRVLGFTDDADFRNPYILAYLVDRTLRSGADGLVAVCE